MVQKKEPPTLDDLVAGYEFTKRELIQYAMGKLDPRRVAVVQAVATQNAELNERIRLIQGYMDPL